jgi:RNA polymerase sigma-70 factor (ECF subfamily)
LGPENKFTATEYATLFQKGDERALAFFYEEFHPALAFYAYRWINDLEIAKEVASSAFVKVWKHHHKLDNYLGIQGYLYKTVGRDACLAMKIKIRRREVYKRARIETTTPEAAVDNLIRAETCRLVRSALATLPKGSRTVLMMYYIEGKKLTTIAEELRLNVSTIKTQKSNGLKALRKRFLRSAALVLLEFMKIICSRMSGSYGRKWLYCMDKRLIINNLVTL